MTVKPCMHIKSNQEYFCPVRLYAQVGNKLVDAKLCVKYESLAVAPCACGWQEAPILRPHWLPTFLGLGNSSSLFPFSLMLCSNMIDGLLFLSVLSNEVSK